MIFFTISLICTFLLGVIGTVIKEPSNSVKIVIVLLMIVTCLYTWVEYRNSLHIENYSKTAGKLYFPVNSKKDITLNFGGNKMISPNKVSNQIGNDNFDIWIEDNQLYLKLTVRDFNGDIIFYINGNDWKNISGQEFNFDENGIEVLDSKGRVVLQLDYNSAENTITHYGLSYYGTNNILWNGKDSSGNSSTIINPNNLDSLTPLEPIFKYPTENYRGKRVIH